MRINKLAIQNFRNHKATAIEPDRLNIFLGRNNSGKSSILAAIEWALTGRNNWTDRAGRGAGDLITRGEKGCQVGLELEGFGSIVRATPPHTLAAGKTRSVQDGQAAIYHHLGVEEKLVQLVMNAGTFTGMSPLDQKAFLFSLCGISFTAEDISSAVFNHAQGSGKDMAREIANRAKALVPRGIDGDPGILEGMEKRAREMRKEAKKDLERTRSALAELELPNIPNGYELDDKETVVRQLDELENEKNSLLKAHGERRAAEKNITLCRDRVNSLTSETERLAAEKDGLEQQAGDADQAELTRELNRLVERKEQLAGVISEFDREIAALKAASQAKDEVAAKLREFNGRCPLAPEIIACRMSGNEVAELAGKLDTEIKDGAQKIKHLQSQIENLQVEKEGLREQKAHIEKTLSGLAGIRQEINNLEAAIARSQREINNTWQEASAWEEALHTSGADPEAIDSLQEQIIRGREILRQLEIAEHGRQQAAQLQKDLEILEQEVAIVEHLVKALGPDGIRKSLLGGQLNTLTNQLNSQLAAYTEGHYQLTWQKDFTPLITQNGHSLPVKLLSKSEQLRVGIAFQAAIAKQVGLKFLAIDEVDMLDQDNRDLLTGSLLEVLDEFDQIMLFCTVGDVLPKNPNLPGVKMFWLESGAVREL